MHDERDLRAVPAAARRSANRQDELRVLLLQPGPAARPGGFPRPRPAPRAERRPGETHRTVDRALPEAAAAARGTQGRMTRRRLRALWLAAALALASPASA